MKTTHHHQVRTRKGATIQALVPIQMITLAQTARPVVTGYSKMANNQKTLKAAHALMLQVQNLIATLLAVPTYTQRALKTFP